MQDRPYQKKFKDDIYTAWAQGHRVVGGVLPTGAGKTHCFSGVLHDHANIPTCAIAHRKELVGQISLALARHGVRHNIIGPKELVRYAVNNQMNRLGTSFYSMNANCTVVAVRTLISRAKQYESWARNVQLWVLDEAHHLLRDNEWGKAVEMFQNARGLGVTATPCRADGKGLGSMADGFIDTLVEGPTMRDLINQGYLCDYKVICPSSDIRNFLSQEDVGSTGDYTARKLKSASKKSHIVGDTVDNYLKYAKGKRTIVFATDVETAMDLAVKFRERGVRAEAVSGDTDARLRDEVTGKFESGELDVLINVDLFGEGYDVPAIECVMFARPTESFGLFCQMWGRALRILEGKSHGIIIDQVGNVVRHGLPDAPREWNLWGKEKRPRTKNPEDTIPQTICVPCTQPYPKYLTACPYCGAPPAPAGRSSLEEVDGDLEELSPEVLAKMRGDMVKALETPEQVRMRVLAAGQPGMVAQAQYNRRKEKFDRLATLGKVIEHWADRQLKAGRTEREMHKMFYLLFGVDVMTAKTLPSKEIDKLSYKICETMGGPRGWNV